VNVEPSRCYLKTSAEHHYSTESLARKYASFMHDAGIVKAALATSLE